MALSFATKDLILAVGTAILGVLILPSLFDSRARVPLLTSLTSGVLLVVMTATFVSLGLDLTAGSTAFASLAWLLVATFRRPKPQSESNARVPGTDSLIAADLCHPRVEYGNPDSRDTAGPRKSPTTNTPSRPS